jgi:hypothetical protein
VKSCGFYHRGHNMIINTEFGYYVKDGLKVSKYELPRGKHPDLPKGMTFVEVPDKKSLDAITLDPKPLTVQQQKKNIIHQLNQIDSKTIRALRTNDQPRLSVLEGQAIVLRQQLAALGE